MLARWFPALTAGCVLTTAFPVQVAAAEKPEPTLIVRVRSLDALMADAKYVATLAGTEEVAKQVEGIIKARIGAKGLDGIDPKRPLGFYGAIGGDLSETATVAMVPIADEKALLKLLKGLKLDAEKGKDGLYTVRPDFLPVEIYFRIVKKYAYVTALNADAIDKDKLLDPKTVLPAGETTLASASLYIDRIPNTIKQIALSQLELRAKQLQNQKPPRETEAQEKFRVQVLQDLAAMVASIIKEGKEISVKFEVDRQAGKLSAVYGLTGKSGSGLSQDIADLGKATSLFAGLVSPNTAASGLVHFTLPKGMLKALQPALDEALKQLQEKEPDETKRALGERFLKALAPSVKSGELDVLVNLGGPSKNGLYTGIAALKLKDAVAIDKVLRDTIKLAPETERAKIKFDADKANGVVIHQVTIKDDTDPATKKLFGDNPLYFAFRQDALFVTLGDNGLDAIKAAINSKAKASPLAQYEVSLARLVPLISAYSKNDALAKIAKETFGEEAKDPGTIRFSLSGGKALTVEYNVSAAVVKFLSQVVQSKAVRVSQPRAINQEPKPPKKEVEKPRPNEKKP